MTLKVRGREKRFFIIRERQIKLRNNNYYISLFFLFFVVLFFFFFFYGILIKIYLQSML